MKKQFLTIAISLAVSKAVAGGVTGGATEFTQMLNNSELMAQVITAKEQLDKMITDLQKLQSFASSGQALADALGELNGIVQYGQALAYNAENLSTEFEKRFGDFNSYANQFGVKSDRYQKWSRQNLDSIHGSLRAANLQSKYFASQSQTISEIERRSQTAVGRDQILQAGVDIAAQQARQMVELRQLIAADMQMQANYQASLVDRQAEEDARQLNAISGNISDNLGTGRTYHSDRSGPFK